MNLKEYIKCVNEINKNIQNLIKDNKGELSFYELLVNTFNQVCEERNNLEQALDEIEKYVIENSQYWDETGLRYWKDKKDEPHDILEIIQKSKGDVKNESKS